MPAALVQHEDVQALVKGPRELVQKDLKHAAVQVRQFQKEVFTGHRCNGAIDVEPVKHVLDRPNWLHASRRQATAAHREQPKAAFILAKDLDRTRVV